jgi:uncharacterized protein YbdZ (MbtH family)
MTYPRDGGSATDDKSAEAGRDWVETHPTDLRTAGASLPHLT